MIKPNGLLRGFLLFCLILLHYSSRSSDYRNNEFFQGDFVVSGRVVDESGQPLAGVSVSVRAGGGGGITESNGFYKIKLESTVDVIEFSLVGYETQEVKVNNRPVINITLKRIDQQLNQVVIIGYGSQKRSDLTGSVGSVKANELQERPALSVEQALAGRVAGVNVATNSGRPGGRTAVHIRGYTSIQASNNPLYVVDGIVFTGDITTINPNEIESIDVLKDASATAIYGTRGSNGVIVITTRRGKGKAVLNYSNNVSVNKMARKQMVLNSAEFLYIEEEAYKNAAKFDPAGFASGKYMDPLEKRKRYLVGNTEGNRELFRLSDSKELVPLYDVDWQDLVTRTSLSTAHNLSLSGSGENSNYSLSLGYNDEEGIIKESYLKRYNVRSSMEQDVNSWFKLGGTMNFSITNERRVDSRQGWNNVLRQMIEMVPFIPYKYPDGTYGYRGDYAGLEGGDNPLAQIYENITLFNTRYFGGNAFSKITFSKQLSFTSTFGANSNTQRNPLFTSTKSDLVPTNQASVDNRESLFWQWSNVLNYSVPLKEGHTANVLIGNEFQKYNYYQSVITTENLSDDYYDWYNLGAGANLKSPSSSFNEFQMASYFTRANYTFKNKYLLTATGRFDGSSRFGASNKFAFFPSAAFAWRVSNEEFLRNSRLISNLKFRTSYGRTGNSEIGSFLSLATLSTTAYPFGGIRTSGIGVGRLSNPLLKWEKTDQFDVGAELSLLDNRIRLEVDYYIKTTTGLLLAAPVPSSSGYSSLVKNIGSMRNSGFEFTINTTNIKEANFSWGSDLNISTLKNKIIALGLHNEDIILSPNNTNILRVGESVGSFFGYIRDGVYGEDEADLAAKYGKKAGDAKIRDLDNNGIINEKDRTIIGKGIPDFYGSFSNHLRYKQFDFLVELQFSVGNKIFMDMIGTAEARQGLANSYISVLDAWTPQYQNTMIEQWRPASAGYTSLKDTRRIKDGSFLRGKNVSLGYNFPLNKTNSLPLKNFRVFISGQNLFVITKYPGYDPEVTSYDETFAQGIEFHGYPKARTVVAGLNISF